jgi:hypothetical protein
LDRASLNPEGIEGGWHSLDKHREEALGKIAY